MYSVPEAVVIVQETGLRLAKKMNRLNKKKQEGGGVGVGKGQFEPAAINTRV